jgi:diadenosine tetraphosphatase ApaH/serine/threonine PP2A family protein phosphatase
MRIVIVADIHSNLEAFEAVLEHASAHRPIERLWCLGDVVGYAADPSACIALLRQYPHTAVAGNHDLAAVGKLSTDDFNVVAARAAAWTGEHLSAEEQEYLSSLPFVVVEGDFTLVHGSLRSPEWEYLLSADAAAEHFVLQETPYGLVGHSHVPFVAYESPPRADAMGGLPAMARLEDGDVLKLGEVRLIVNPGGVGQPRDGDPRASYAIYDSESRTITLHRVEYDLEKAQRKILEARLPSYLAERLAYGR